MTLKLIIVSIITGLASAAYVVIHPMTRAWSLALGFFAGFIVAHVAIPVLTTMTMGNF